MTYEKVPKSEKKFNCLTCDYDTSRKSQYERHLATDKHKTRQNTYKLVPTVSQIECVCGRIYKHKQSLTNHKKKCDHLKIDKMEWQWL